MGGRAETQCPGLAERGVVRKVEMAEMAIVAKVDQVAKMSDLGKIGAYFASPGSKQRREWQRHSRQYSDVRLVESQRSTVNKHSLCMSGCKLCESLH